MSTWFACHSAKIYRMAYPLDLDGWREAVLETIRVNDMKACYIRPLIYRGYDTLGVNPLGNPVDAAIMVWEWGTYLGAEALETGRRRQGEQLGAHGAQHVAGDGEVDRQLRQLRAHQDGSAASTATPKGIALDVARLRQRRQRPEHLRRPQRT